MTEAQVIARLRHKQLSFMSQKHFARSLGVSDSFLSEVLRGRRPPTGPILDALGLVRVVTYRRKA